MYSFGLALKRIIAETAQQDSSQTEFTDSFDAKVLHRQLEISRKTRYAQKFEAFARASVVLGPVYWVIWLAVPH
jgi:hypothetical protein